MSEISPADKFARLPERYQRRAREIAARVSEIDRVLSPVAITGIIDTVKRLRGQFRPQPETADGDTATAFRDACKDLPEWALSESANDFLAGRIENHTGQFMPTSAEFAKHCREIIRPFLAERYALKVEASKLIERAEDEARRNAIAVERSNPAVRKRVAELVASVTAGLPSPHSRPRQQPSTDHRAVMDKLRKPKPFRSKIAETKIVKGGH